MKKKKLETRWVKYNDIDLVLEGVYYKGSPSTHDYPGDSEEFEVHSVYIGEVEISDILSENQVREIGEKALEK